MAKPLRLPMELSLFTNTDSFHRLAMCHVSACRHISDMPASDSFTRHHSPQVSACLEVTQVPKLPALPVPIFSWVSVVPGIWFGFGLFILGVCILTSIPSDYSAGRSSRLKLEKDNMMEMWIKSWSLPLPKPSHAFTFFLNGR